MHNKMLMYYGPPSTNCVVSHFTRSLKKICIKPYSEAWLMMFDDVLPPGVPGVDLEGDEGSRHNGHHTTTLLRKQFTFFLLLRFLLKNSSLGQTIIHNKT